MRSGRGQLSTTVVEAGIGVVLIFAVTTTFALGVPSPDTQQAQLDTYATDTATVLAEETPRHQDATRLSELAQSEESFERERDTLERRVETVLPDNLLYRIETEHGAIGMQRPDGVAYGTTTVTTEYGKVTLSVWYV